MEKKLEFQKNNIKSFVKNKKEKGYMPWSENHECRICRKRTPNEDFAEDVSEYCGNRLLVSKLLRYVPKDVIDESGLSCKSSIFTGCRICNKCKKILDFTKKHSAIFEEYKASMTCGAPANKRIWNSDYKGFYVPKSACEYGIVKTKKTEYTKQSHGHTIDNTDQIGIVENNEKCPKCKGSSIDQSKLKAKIKTMDLHGVIPGYKNL